MAILELSTCYIGMLQNIVEKLLFCGRWNNYEDRIESQLGFVKYTKFKFKNRQFTCFFVGVKLN